MGRKAKTVPTNGPAVEETSLSRWLHSTGLSAREVAREVGVDVATVTHWAGGRVLPSLPGAFRLEQVSRGKVQATSWLGTILGREASGRMAAKARGR
jgi:transcriptional regulator with XRE-family HTH domain